MSYESYRIIKDDVAHAFVDPKVALGIGFLSRSSEDGLKFSDPALDEAHWDGFSQFFLPLGIADESANDALE